MSLINNHKKGESRELLKLVKSLEVPIESFIATNEKYSNMSFKKLLNESVDDRKLLKSKDILDLLKEFMKSTEQIILGYSKPIIYDIYLTEEKVKKNCNIRINTEKISDLDVNWLLEFENYINKNIALNNLCLDDISIGLSTSERQVYRKIKKLLNITPNKYVRILKLHKAKQIIEDYTYDNVSQISYAIGFNDVHYFSQLFCNQYGVTPRLMLNSDYNYC
jgi:AraC-like DNA-binding protein